MNSVNWLAICRKFDVAIATLKIDQSRTDLADEAMNALIDLENEGHEPPRFVGRRWEVLIETLNKRWLGTL